jgi:L-threonylcarbamoyladenylate synthase
VSSRSRRRRSTASGADATNVHAVAKIFLLKGRPTDHPLIVHVADPDGLDRWCVEIPPAARALAERFWPGPLTLILRKSPRFLRSSPVARKRWAFAVRSIRSRRRCSRRLRKWEAARSPRPRQQVRPREPDDAQHVREEFGEDLCLIDGGACEVGLESTILDLSRGAPVLLRPGGVTREDIAAIIGDMPRDRDADAPRASGTLAAHYAPRTALAVLGAVDFEAEIAGVRASPSSRSARHPRARTWSHGLTRRPILFAMGTTCTPTCGRSTGAGPSASWCRRRRGAPNGKQ